MLRKAAAEKESTWEAVSSSKTRILFRSSKCIPPLSKASPAIAIYLFLSRWFNNSPPSCAKVFSACFQLRLRIAETPGWYQSFLCQQHQSSGWNACGSFPKVALVGACGSPLGGSHKLSQGSAAPAPTLPAVRGRHNHVMLRICQKSLKVVDPSLDL